MTAAPGPYFADSRDGYTVIVASDGYLISEVYNDHDPDDTAALLAAAWELRAALERYVADERHYMEFADRLDDPSSALDAAKLDRYRDARAALAKANGEVPPCD